MTNNEADNLLIRWGAWSRHNISIGYSSENIIYKMMREGGGAGHISVFAEIQMPADIERADAIIAKFRRGIKKAVRLRYIANLADQAASKICRCTEAEFSRRVNYAIDTIAVALE